MTPTGVLLFSHGTPASPAAIGEFYTAIRRGNPPSPELLDDLVRRYEAIGGTSPLAEITARQAAAIGGALGPGYRVEIGYKFARPSIEDACAALVRSGTTAAVAAVLSPHYSTFTTEDYFSRARAAAGAAMSVSCLKDWHLAGALVSFHAGQITRLVAREHEWAPGESARVFFSAHSMPVSTVQAGDPYCTQVGETARTVAEHAGIPPGCWSIAWQSAGRTDQEWVGPDLTGAVRESAAEGVERMVVCPVGFAADNLEILYDLDIEVASMARSCGAALRRTRLPNDDPGVAAGLAAAITDTAGTP